MQKQKNDEGRKEGIVRTRERKNERKRNGRK